MQTFIHSSSSCWILNMQTRPWGGLLVCKSQYWLQSAFSNRIQMMKLLFFEALRWLTLKRKSSLGEVLPQGVSSARNWQKEITFLTDYPSYRYIHYTTKQRKCLLNLIFGQFQDPHIFHVRSAWYLLQSTLIF